MKKTLIAGLAAKYSMELRRQFSYLVNGFSAYVAESAIQDLALEKGVAAVDRMRVYYPTMESAVTATQADVATESTTSMGEGSLYRSSIPALI